MKGEERTEDSSKIWLTGSQSARKNWKNTEEQIDPRTRRVVIVDVSYFPPVKYDDWQNEDYRCIAKVQSFNFAAVSAGENEEYAALVL